MVGTKIFPAPKLQTKSWWFFYFKKEVYLVKVAFASEILDFFRLRRGTFLNCIFDFVPLKQYLNLFTVYYQKYEDIYNVSSAEKTKIL